MEKIKVGPGPGPGYIIKEKGIFNLEKLISELKKWFNEQEYDFYEKKKKHKPSKYGNRIELKWLIERKIDHMVKYEMDVEFLIIDIAPAGEDLVSGKLEMVIDPNIILDYEDAWKPTRFKNFLMKLFKNIYYKDIIKKHKTKLDSEVNTVREIVKEIFEFYR
jgi:hypothetical protein